MTSIPTILRETLEREELVRRRNEQAAAATLARWMVKLKKEVKFKPGKTPTKKGH